MARAVKAPPSVQWARFGLVLVALVWLLVVLPLTAVAAPYAALVMDARSGKVLYARNGLEAVKLTKRHNPQVIFMDMSMPEMDGIEATRTIREADIPQPTIIALTANAYASDKATCLSAGMDGFLAKPLKRSDLLACLAQL